MMKKQITESLFLRHTQGLVILFDFFTTQAAMKVMMKVISSLLYVLRGRDDWWDAGCLLQPPAGPQAKLPLTPADPLEQQRSPSSSVCVVQGGGGCSCVVAILVIAVLLWERHQGSLTAAVWQASRVRSESCWKLICTGNVELWVCDRESQIERWERERKPRAEQWTGLSGQGDKAVRD